MNLFFFNVPGHGHVNPSMPLVGELVRRGHQVTYFTTESFRKRVEAKGASVEILSEVPDDYFARHGQNGSTPWEIARILQETSAEVLPGLLKLVDERKPDAILYDCMCPWGYYTARAARLPAIASYSLIPMTPHMMRDWRVLKLSMGTAFAGIGSLPKAIKVSRQIARKYRLETVGMMEMINMHGDLCIVYSSTEFVPHAKTFGPEFRFVGWTLQEPVVTEPLEHKSGRPLIYASLGTLINDNKAFFQSAIEAVSGSDYDLLISTGGAFKPSDFGALPPNITVREWVPQAHVLRQASLFITHGGVNSIQDGLYCNLPLLVAPQQQEQTINGFAVIDQGAGLMLKRDELNAATVRSAISRLLAEPAFAQNAQRLGKSLRTGGGAVVGVDAIEHLLEN